MVSNSQTRLGLAAALGLVAWSSLAPLSGAQETSSPWPTTLLRRAAAAVDGQSIGDTVFIVVARAFPHDVAGVFKTQREAEAARPSQQSFVVLGPLTPLLPDGLRTLLELRRHPPEAVLEKLRKIMVGGGGCVHSPTSVYRGGGARYCGLGGAIPIRDVASITVSTRLKDGRSSTVTLPADSVDAIFFTVSAMDAFVFPYYERMFGLDYAAWMREDILNRLSQ